MVRGFLLPIELGKPPKTLLIQRIKLTFKLTPLQGITKWQKQLPSQNIVND